MGQIFAKQKPRSRVTDEDKAILQLKMERDKLKMTMKRYEKSMERDKQLAKELLHNGQKDRALLLLKKKKLAETTIERIDKHLLKIEQMTSDIEMAQINMSVLEKLSEGSKALQVVNRAFSIDEIEKIMSDTQEAAEYQYEITSMLSGKLSDDDLDDVEREFDELFHVELPEAPDDELEAVKEAGGLRKERRKNRVAVAAT
ncbi:hypothetical protein M3Y97_00280000 [Aphelenchoides bicaudatus]|nr:hypothetical protein M3Y97_00280000 [Aphelenchoides bicaudatus]